MSLRTSSLRLTRLRSPLRSFASPPPSSPPPPSLFRRSFPLVLTTTLTLSTLYLLSPPSLFQIHADADVQTTGQPAPTLARRKPKEKLAQSQTEDKGRNRAEWIGMEEVEKHRGRQNGGEKESVWVVVNGDVWDVTDWLPNHPGGSKIILTNAGKDVSKLFNPIHPPNTLQTHLRPDQLIGQIDPAISSQLEVDPDEDEERCRKAREALGHVDSMVNVGDFEKICEPILSKQAWAYYSSASDDETARWHANTAYQSILFRPRILRPVRDVDPSCTILGHKSTLPIYVSPAALARLGDEDGEMNITKGAGKKGIIQAISSFASCSLEELNSVRIPDQPLFWQLYVKPDRVATEKTIRSALKQGMNAIFLTVDAPVGGKREQDMRLKIAMDPPTDDDVPGEEGGGTSEQLFSAVDPNLCWDDLAWIRKIAPDVPLVIKGIQCVEDAVLAVEHKVDGIVISNHGGRQLEYSRPPIQVLQEIRKLHPEVLDQTEIFIDGGVKRGTDVLKAICLGAKAVGMGRPFLYAQSAYKDRGVEKVIDIMHAEIEMGMRLLGVTKLSELGPEYIEVLESTPYRSSDRV